MNIVIALLMVIRYYSAGFRDASSIPPCLCCYCADVSENLEKVSSCSYIIILS